MWKTEIGQNLVTSGLAKMQENTELSGIFLLRMGENPNQMA